MTEDNEVYMKLNEFQTSLEDSAVQALPREVFVELCELINDVEFIDNITSYKMREIEDMPKDNEGKVIVDLAKPHALRNIDYFRQSAITYSKEGKYTSHTPSKHPNSPYFRFWKEERRRCKEGLIRDDGEWISGELYFYWNYCPIMLTKEDGGNSKKAQRTQDFPNPWLGDYLFFHYYNKAQVAGKHVVIIKSRGIGFSFKMAIFGAHRALFYKNLKTFYTAYEKEYLNKDGILNKTWDYLDFIAQNTPFPRIRSIDSLQRMQLKLSYKDMTDGSEKGTKGEIQGVSAKDNVGKLRGKRGMIVFEEFGKFPGVSDVWNICRPSVEDGQYTFAQLVAGGTGGEEGNDFAGAEDMIYHPEVYNVMPLLNVYDKNTTGTTSAMHWGSYLSRKGCINKDGMPDVVIALVQILSELHLIKMSSSDTKALTQRRAELAITIQDAIMRTEGTLFPVGELKFRLEEIAPKYDAMLKSHYTGELILKNGVPIWRPDKTLYPINRFPFKEGNTTGAYQLFEMPKKNSQGKVFSDRYISGLDPVDNDGVVTTISLQSMFIFDLWTDRIVAEYTGRPKFADEYYENVRRLLIFYNASCNYEQNKKGIFSYFDRKGSLNLLCETPEFLRDSNMTKVARYGNTRLGTNASGPINELARRLIAQWLLKPAHTQEKDEEGNQVGEKINIDTIQSKPLLEELIKWKKDLNCDRVSALGMLMILREEKLKNLDDYRGKEETKPLIITDTYFSKYDEDIKPGSFF